mgnify:CR=1 FL=1
MFEKFDLTPLLGDLIRLGSREELSLLTSLSEEQRIVGQSARRAENSWTSSDGSSRSSSSFFFILHPFARNRAMARAT